MWARLTKIVRPSDALTMCSRGLRPTCRQQLQGNSGLPALGDHYFPEVVRILQGGAARTGPDRTAGRARRRAQAEARRISSVGSMTACSMLSPAASRSSWRVIRRPSSTIGCRTVVSGGSV
ncbi:hypothetical protein LUPAC07_05498 [Micromonospora noduli]|nr:hypothetical protein LUPAC07_05498 [Micromonospora noduli]